MMEQKKDSAACPHRWTQIIAGPMLSVHKCYDCGAEIVDVIDRGPGRMVIDPAGVVWVHGEQS